jgi:hypothetical protein
VIPAESSRLHTTDLWSTDFLILHTFPHLNTWIDTDGIIWVESIWFLSMHREVVNRVGQQSSHLILLAFGDSQQATVALYYDNSTRMYLGCRNTNKAKRLETHSQPWPWVCFWIVLDFEKKMWGQWLYGTINHWHIATNDRL